MSLTTSRGKATVGQLCEAFGISRQAYYAARQQRRVEAAGGEGPGRRRPERRGPWASEATLARRIRETVTRFPAWGVRKVWAYMRRTWELVVSRKRVWKVMRALGLTLPPLSERVEPLRRGHVAVPESNRRWATDLTTTWTARDGTAALVPVIDCGDRVVFAVRVTKSQDSPAVLAPVAGALEEAFGRPAAVPDGLELRTDHGPQYTGADCEELCAAWRLDHTFAPVGRPTGNAVAERFIQTLKVELLWTRDWESIAELQREVDRWLVVYNQVRPHEALAWKTPAEKRAENLGVRLNRAA
jgi:transposase InsO family protein